MWTRRNDRKRCFFRNYFLFFWKIIIEGLKDTFFFVVIVEWSQRRHFSYHIKKCLKQRIGFHYSAHELTVLFISRRLVMVDFGRSILDCSSPLRAPIRHHFLREDWCLVAKTKLNLWRRTKRSFLVSEQIYVQAVRINAKVHDLHTHNKCTCKIEIELLKYYNATHRVYKW